MTTRPRLLAGGVDPIRHHWRCTRRGPFVETVATSATGQATVVITCQECNHTDEHNLTANPEGN